MEAKLREASENKRKIAAWFDYAEHRASQGVHILTENDQQAFEYAWQAALSTLPRMTEEEIASILLLAYSEATNVPANGPGMVAAARALIARLSHIEKGE